MTKASTRGNLLSWWALTLILSGASFLVLMPSDAAVHCDIFSSTAHLQNLMFLERHLVMSMRDYVHIMESRLDTMRQYLEDYYQSAGRPELQDSDIVEDIAGNPLQAFQLIKRLTIQWTPIREMMKENLWSDIDSLEADYAPLFPKDEDLQGSALSLVRLQDTYNLTTYDLARGYVKDVDSYVTMNARDALFLGKHAFNNGYYGHALDWFRQAMAMAEAEGNRTVSVEEVAQFYNMAIPVYDEMLPQALADEESPIHYNASTKFRLIDGDNEDYMYYQQLCRGEKLKTPAQERELSCFYSDQGNPLLRIQPVKVEILHTNPYVAMFHGLMTPREAEQIRDMAAPILTRAKVQTDNGTTDIISKTRVSQTAWFSQDTDELVRRINSRISAVTGLSTDMESSHSELMQVANYGMGGLYTPHYDYLIVDRSPEERALLEPRETYAGDRTATLMFYLSDVKEGGSTVFTRLKVQLVPKLGSAAFWYNLYRNGEGIIDTIHGACPVLIGEKWVSNYWIREIGQAFRRQCSLDPEE